MSGFFSSSVLKQYDNKRKLQHTECGACGLSKKCKTPKMGAWGRGDSGLMIISERPNSKEDRIGHPLMSSLGETILHISKQQKIDPERDIRLIHSIGCAKTGKVTDTQIHSCKARVFQEIQEYRPDVILLLGSDALRSVIGNVWSKSLGPVFKWRGWEIPDQELRCWVVPTFSPYFVKSQGKSSDQADDLFRKDVEKAIKLLGKKLPEYKPAGNCVEILDDPKEINSRLGWIYEKKPLIEIDYETTGLKPEAKGHKIVSCAVAWSENEAISFFVHDSIKSKLRKILESPRIKKMAHNMKFEKYWSNVRMGVKSDGWSYCSMIGAHVLDNRKSITGLKFQTYVNFGIGDYDSHISPFLSSQTSNGLNRIHEIPSRDLLFYGGCDVIYSYRLALKQLKAFGITEPLKMFKKEKS